MRACLEIKQCDLSHCRGHSVSCSFWARQVALTVRLSTQVYKWVPMMGYQPIQRGVEMLVVASCYRDHSQGHEPLGSYRDFTYGPYSSEIDLIISFFISLQSKRAKEAGTIVYAIGVALYDIQQVHREKLSSIVKICER